MSNKLKLKVRTKLPASLDGRTGINVVKDGLTYHLDLDYSRLVQSSQFDPTNDLLAAWNKATGAWNTINPASLTAGSFHSTTAATDTVPDGTSLVAIQRTSPSATALTLPLLANQGGKALVIVDWSTSVTDHTITITPASGVGTTIMKAANWTIKSSAGQPAAVVIYPSIDLNGWGIAPLTVSFQQSGTGAVVRTMQDKARDIFSVKDFGPTANGIADDSGAFSLAAKAATAASLPTNSTVTTAQSCTVFVPAGTYLLSTMVDTGGRSVDWILEDGATITNPTNLNGRVVRESGLRMARTTHYGCYDTACSLSVTANYSPDEPPAISGFSSDSQISTYAGRDSVTAYIANTLPPALYTLTAPTYTATTVSCPTPVDPKKLKVGMVIDTAHSPKWSGFIRSWAADGSSITVSAWYQNGGGAGTPTSGVNAIVNPFTKIWAQNSGVTLTASSYGTAAAGYELDVYNSQADSNPYATGSIIGQTWGFDSCAVGPNKCSAGFVSRGLWKTGYVSDNALATAVGFATKGAENIGFSYESSSVAGTGFRTLYNGALSFGVTNGGDIEFGRTDAASTTVFDWHSSGNAIDYDARISCSGGTATIGQATLSYVAATHSFSGPVSVNASFQSSVSPGAATVHTLDASSQGGISVATGANAIICPVGQGVLLSVVNSSVSSNCGLFFIAAGAVALITAVGSEFVVSTSPAAGKSGVGFDGTNYRIYNNTGSSVTYKAASVRTA